MSGLREASKTTSSSTSLRGESGVSLARARSKVRSIYVNGREKSALERTINGDKKVLKQAVAEHGNIVTTVTIDGEKIKLEGGDFESKSRVIDYDLLRENVTAEQYDKLFQTTLKAMNDLLGEDVVNKCVKHTTKSLFKVVVVK